MFPKILFCVGMSPTPSETTANAEGVKKKRRKQSKHSIPAVSRTKKPATQEQVLQTGNVTVT